MTIDDIKTLIAADELRMLEMKKNMGKLKDGMHPLCAILNSDGGYIIFDIAPFWRKSKEAESLNGENSGDNSVKNKPTERQRIICNAIKTNRQSNSQDFGCYFGG